MTSGSWGKWLVEIKSGNYGIADLRGLARAAAKFPHFLPIVICDPFPGMTICAMVFTHNERSER